MQPSFLECNSTTWSVHEINIWASGSTLTYLFMHSTMIHSARQEIREAGWFWKITLIKKQHKPNALLQSEGERELRRYMQTTINLHGQFAVYKHGFIHSFLWSSRQQWKMDWGNITSSNFMNQKIRSKHDRSPKGLGTGRDPHLFFLLTMLFNSITESIKL